MGRSGAAQSVVAAATLNGAKRCEGPFGPTRQTGRREGGGRGQLSRDHTN